MRFLISFPSEAMQLTDEELIEVSRTSHAVVDEARNAGVLVFTGGLDPTIDSILVDATGNVSSESYPNVVGLDGGLMVIDVDSVQEAIRWAGKVATGCRCSQQVREFLFDPEVQ